MRKIKIIILFLFINSALIFSQSKWIWQNPLPQGLPLHDVKIIDDFIIAVGVNATVLRSSDKGNSWLFEGSVNDEMGTFSALHFYDTQTGWVVSGDRVLKTSNGGDSWTTINTNTFQVYESIYFTDENTGWVAGSGGSIFKTTDGGASWDPSNNGIQSSIRLYDIYFVNGNIGYTVGKDGSIYKTIDGGVTWNPQASNVTFDLYSVFFLNNNTGWATGIGGTILHTIDGGVTWEPETSSTTITLRSIYFLDDSLGFASGFGEVLKSVNGGQTWNTILELEEKWFTAMDFSNSDGIIVGSNGLIMQTNDMGENWDMKSSGETAFLKDIFLTADNDFWVAGNSGTILRSEDGVSWTKIDSVPSTKPLNKIFFADANNGWAVGGYSAYIINTTNGGNSWHEQTVPSSSLLTSVGFAGTDTGWCSGLQGNILYTTNSGQNWIDQSLNSTPTLNDIHVFNGKTAIIVGEDGLILKTSDGGETWDELNSGTTATLLDIFMLDDLTGWAVGNPETTGGDGTIIMTTDGGNSWTHQTGGTSFQSFASVKFVDSENGVIATSDGLILRTNNGGINWNVEDETLNIPLADIEMTNADNLWVVGQIGAIFKLEFESTTDVKVSLESNPESFILSQNYPNPFNPSTTIKYSINSIEYNPLLGGARGGSNVQLKIYDILGREIALLVNQYQKPGNYEIIFDASSLSRRISSGTYFYRLQTGDVIQTRRMLLLK